MLDCYSSLSFTSVLRPIVIELGAATNLLTLTQRRRAFVGSAVASMISLPVMPAVAKDGYCALIQGASSRSEPIVPLRWRLSQESEGFPIDHPVGELVPYSLRLRRQIIRQRANVELNAEDLSAAVSTIAISYLNDPQMFLMLPISACAELLDEAEPMSMGSPLALAVVYDLYLRYFGDSRPYIRNDAYEDFLAECLVERPSDLSISDFPGKEALLIYFLRYVCVPEVMASSEFFSGSKSLDSERLKVCSLLLRIDPTQASEYEKELREITRKQVINDGLRDVEQSKFAIDVQPLRRWAEKNLKESFARFQALRLAGVRASTLPAATPEIGILIPEAPVDEAATLLHNMLLDFLYESYTNSFYGLDSYLSLRARHGSLSGQLRAPLEEEHIITQRQEGTDQYKLNQYWQERLELEPALSLHIDTLLKTFSRQFDQIAKSYADKQLQIRTADKPEGHFMYVIQEIDLFVLSVEVRTDAAFSTFIDTCLDLFWGNLEESLDRVRNSIDVGLRDQVLKTSSELIRNLEGVRDADQRIDELISAVRRSQTRLTQALLNLQGWFHAPEAASTKLFTLDEIVDISLQQVCRLHPNFAPKLYRDIALSIPILDLRRVSDMFFIMFDNIQKHCGTEEDPKVNIAVTQDAGAIGIEVVSDFEGQEDVETRLSKIRKIIADGRYQHIVKSEGGTGLVKLWNIIRTDEGGLGGGTKLEFGIVDNRFRVYMVMPFTILRQEEARK